MIDQRLEYNVVQRYDHTLRESLETLNKLDDLLRSENFNFDPTQKNKFGQFKIDGKNVGFRALGDRRTSLKRLLNSDFEYKKLDEEETFSLFYGWTNVDVSHSVNVRILDSQPEDNYYANICSYSVKVKLMTRYRDDKFEKYHMKLVKFIRGILNENPDEPTKNPFDYDIPTVDHLIEVEE